MPVILSHQNFLYYSNNSSLRNKLCLKMVKVLAKDKMCSVLPLSREIHCWANLPGCNLRRIHTRNDVKFYVPQTPLERPSYHWQTSPSQSSLVSSGSPCIRFSSSENSSLVGQCNYVNLICICQYLLF